MPGRLPVIAKDNVVKRIADQTNQGRHAWANQTGCERCPDDDKPLPADVAPHLTNNTRKQSSIGLQSVHWRLLSSPIVFASPGYRTVLSWPCVPATCNRPVDPNEKVGWPGLEASSPKPRGFPREYAQPRPLVSVPH